MFPGPLSGTFKTPIDRQPPVELAHRRQVPGVRGWKASAMPDDRQCDGQAERRRGNVEVELIEIDAVLAHDLQ